MFAPRDGDGAELALVALDIGWLQYAPDERGLRASIRERTDLREASELVIDAPATPATAPTAPPSASSRHPGSRRYPRRRPLD